MHDVIEMIDTVFDLPVDSSLGAIQLFNKRARNGSYHYGNVLRSILGFDCEEFKDPDHARVQVGYTIQLAINAHVAGEKIDPKTLYTNASAKAKKFADEMSWVFAKKEADVKLDSSGKPRAKKGSKAVRTYEVYCDLVSKDTARKDIITAFQNEAVMAPAAPHTKSGATTYYYNMKKKYEAENG